MGEDWRSIEISDDTLAALESKARDGETAEETIARLLDAT